MCCHWAAPRRGGFGREDAGAAGGADALGEEVVGVVPGAGVAVDVGGAEAEGDGDEVAAVEGELRAGEGEADAAGGGALDGDVGGEVLDGVEVEVDGLGVGGGVGVSLPGVGLEGGVGEVVAREGGRVRTRMTVPRTSRVRPSASWLEGVLLGDGGLDLGGPTADRDPEGVDRDDGDARGFAEGEEGEGEEEERGGGEERGWAASGWARRSPRAKQVSAASSGTRRSLRGSTRGES